MVYIRGVYLIRNLQNSKVYIGISTNILSRKKYHFSSLRNGNHDNDHLQKSFDKYGEQNFRFEIIKETDGCLSTEEMKFIAHFKSNNPNYGYNKTAGGEYGCLGHRHSEDTLQKISRNNAKNKEVEIDGVRYHNISEALRKTGLKIDHRTLSRRCSNEREKWSNYKFVEKIGEQL